jgi:hypothetical protein
MNFLESEVRPEAMVVGDAVSRVLDLEGKGIDTRDRNVDR